MKKKIVALLATIAAVFGFGLATSTAMADENAYGSATTVTGTTASFEFANLTPGESYYVEYEDTYVESVTLAAIKQSNSMVAPESGILHATYKFKSNAPAGSAVTATMKNSAGNVVATATATVPSTGAGDTTNGNGANTNTNTTANTGAAVAPYAVAVVLMAAAGMALFAVRKKATR